jgi:preprotein translocase subunit SecD
MVKIRFFAIFLLIMGALLGYFIVAPYFNTGSVFGRHPFRLGLDLRGGVHLVYRADVASLESSSSSEISEAMAGLRDVIERRVNFFGVTEPLIQVEQTGSALNPLSREQRLIVELPGVVNLNEAIEMIGATPYLEFKTERPQAEQDVILEAQKKNQRTDEDPYFIPTQLTGRYLKKATLDFDQTTYAPSILLEFNKEGEELFAKITKENVGKRVAIYLDGAPISVPVVREEITSGRAQITGDFKPQEAKELVRNLNSGALPIPITLISQQSIGASLGEAALEKDLWAGLVGILAVVLFLIFWYRLPGLIAVFALCLYVILSLFLFKLIPVTLTAAGIAGFILSIGMAVDANILIFERMKEEVRSGKTFQTAMEEGFKRAWLSIRDSNISSLITCVILYWLGTSMVKGFALTLGIGILVSMFSAVFVSRTFLLALGLKESKWYVIAK